MGTTKKCVRFKSKGKEYSLLFSMNAMVAYQERSGEPFINGLGLVEKDPTDFVRLLGIFWAGMFGQEVTRDEVGDIMDDLGITKAYELITQAGHISFPVPEKTASKSGGTGGKKRAPAKT